MTAKLLLDWQPFELSRYQNRTKPTPVTDCEMQQSKQDSMKRKREYNYKTMFSALRYRPSVCLSRHTGGSVKNG